MSFLYYMPGRGTPPTLSDLAALGLDYAFPHDRQLCTPMVAANGPDGGSGMIAAYDTLDRPIGFYREQQTWRKKPASDIWVGLYKEQKPGPAELAKEKVIHGHAIALGDGQQWTIPLVRGFAEADGEITPYLNLPRGSKLDDTGTWVRGDVLPPYRAIWNDAQAWMDLILGSMGEGKDHAAEGVKVKFEFADLHQAAVRVLQVNYRLSDVEAAMLELLSEEASVEVMNATCDLRSLAVLSKKKASAAGG